MSSARRGFTLIEFLVVIAIMGIVGAFTLANYRSFGEDRNLKNAALDVQSFLRFAQSNATSGSKCQNQGTLSWIVAFTNNTTLDLKCQNSSGTSSGLKPLSLPAGITYITTTGTCTSTSVTFAPLSGTMTTTCGLNVTVTLTDKKNNKKQVIIDQGGRIYGQ